MKYGETHEFEVTHVDRKGYGCGLVNDRPACMAFTIPGEKVRGQYVRRRKGVKKFELEELLRTSPDRTEPACPHAGTCGGCAWQHIRYRQQLELKRNLVNESLRSAGIEPLIEQVAPAPDTLGYRNRMDFCVGPEGQVGLKEPGRWNSYVDLDQCLLLGSTTADILREFKGWLRDNDVEPWNVFRHEGYARYLVVREGKNTGQRLIIVVTAEGELPARDDLLRRLTPFATTIYHGINPTLTDLSYAQKLELLYGEELLHERVDQHNYLIPPNSFFQTNTAMAERLLQEVRRHVTAAGAKRLLDLYCGVGFFAVGLADLVESAHGVELDEEAITAARRNAELNNLDNLTFTDAAAESLIWENEQPDLTIIDPPRAGLHPKVIKTLLERRPSHLVYVSCNHASFAREWEQLRVGYRIEELTAFDLFPNSPHVELVTKLIARTD